MPTYQYACTECEHDFEQVQSFSDDALTACPQCTGRLRKIYNAVGVVFKGSGFYRNDSRSDAQSSGQSEDKAGANGDKPDAKASPDGAAEKKSDASKSSSESGTSSGSSTPSESSSRGSKPTKPKAGAGTAS